MKRECPFCGKKYIFTWMSIRDTGRRKLAVFDAALSEKTWPFVKGALAVLLVEIASIALIWYAYGQLYDEGEAMQKCFLTGIAVGIASASVLVAILDKLSGGSLPGGTITHAFLVALSTIILSSNESTPIGKC